MVGQQGGGEHRAERAGADLRGELVYRAFFEATQPYPEDSVCVNNVGDEGPGPRPSAYGQNYRRLAIPEK